MNILVSNDDGVRAEGLQHLVRSLQAFGQVVAVAPDRNRSGASSSLTLDVPLRLEQIAANLYAVNGSPADCVHLGCYRVMQETPTLVVSGINHGANLGDDVLYSGTVAAALEGRHLGLPAIAVSLAAHTPEHFETAARVVTLVVAKMQREGLSNRMVLNLNVPDCPYAQLSGFEVTRLGSRHRVDTLLEDRDPKGRKIYWLGPPSDGDDVGPGTDFYALSQGRVSITPISTDFTAHEALQPMAHWIEDLG